MISSRLLAVMLSAASAVQARPKCGGSCAADECFSKASLPAAFQPTLTDFCYQYLSSTPATVTVTTTTTQSSAVTETVTSTATASVAVTDTITETVTFTPSPDPATISLTEMTTIGTITIITTPCQTTVTSTVSKGVRTQIFYPSRAPTAVEKRLVASPTSVSSSLSANSEQMVIPTELSHGCKPNTLSAKLSSACFCILASATTATVTTTEAATTINTDVATLTETVTVTSTVSATATATNTAATADPLTVTATISTFSFASVETCVSTTTVVTTVTTTGAFTCGIPSPTAVAKGSIDCGRDLPVRLEGSYSEGTIFEGCLDVTPGLVSTASGGTHNCDGTNNNANPAPVRTGTRGILAAGQVNGFDFDGTWDSQFQDYYITRIAGSEKTNSQEWGILDNYQYAPSGGCEYGFYPGSSLLWAYDAFNKGAFLKISPDYQVVKAGSADGTVTVKVTDGMSDRDAPNASIVTDQGTVSSDSSGNVQISVPQEPGCYQYKATRGDDLRSNAFYLTVLPADED